MANEVIRNKAKQAKVKLWEVANYCGIADSTFSRQMRRELPAEKQELILNAIEQIAMGNTEREAGKSVE